MKMLLIECSAEELRANRTILDAIGECVESFVGSLKGVDLSSMAAEDITKGMEDLEEAADDQ